MSKVVSAQIRGELLRRFEENAPDEEDEIPRSEYVRNLLDDGLTPLYAELGVEELPDGLDTVGARLEDDRKPGEEEAAVVRRFLKDAIDARDADALDKIGAEEELKTAVENVREEGEPLEDAVRRCVRSGVEAEQGDTVAGANYDQARSIRPFITGFAIPTAFFFLVMAAARGFSPLGEMNIPFYADLATFLGSITVLGLLMTFCFVFIYSYQIMVGAAAERQGWEQYEDLPRFVRPFFSSL
jgi:hypothetical protein